MYARIVYTVLFYLAAFLIIFLLTKISPNAQDGGLGLGGMVLMLLPIVSLVLAGLNLYRGIRIENYYFIVAGIHVVVMIFMISRFFL